jgi:hypothetical protein
MRRILKIIEAMKQLSQLLEVFVIVNKPVELFGYVPLRRAIHLPTSNKEPIKVILLISVHDLENSQTGRYLD